MDLDGQKRLVYALSCILIVFSLLAQKVALPMTGNAISVSFLIYVFVTAELLRRSAIRVANGLTFTLMAFFTLVALEALMMPYNRISLPSICLVFVAQFPLITRTYRGIFDVKAIMTFFSSIMFTLALVGVAQYASEWVLPRQISFPLDYYLPESLRLVGYNNLNPLEYGSDRIKSNGVFFAEPSFFSQAIALGALVELNASQRPVRIIAFIAALIVSYSGTGFMIFIPGAIYVLIRKRSVVLGICCLLVIAFVPLVADLLNLDALTRRVGEFSLHGTSGNARFVSIFELISRFQIQDASDFFFGKGAGQITPFINLLPYDGFGPTWGKVFFEFGFAGLLIYGFFLVLIVKGKRAPLKWPILITYLFLGGYLSDVSILTPMLLFVCWAPGNDDHIYENASGRWPLRSFRPSCHPVSSDGLVLGTKL